MHKITTTLLLAACLLTGTLFGQSSPGNIVTSDLDNFWIAYDRIVQTPDSLERLRLINELYINKGTEGLKGLIAARNYRDTEYVNAILSYPKYWNSVRANSAKIAQEAAQIENYFARFKAVYPELKPATVYFAIGVFRSPGTYQGDKVLMGAEFYLADQNTVLDELPERVQRSMKAYMPYDVPLTALHESVHTRQKRWEDLTIIHLCVAEGVAEFVSTLLAEKPLSPPVKFGKQNADRVLQQYMKEIFRDDDVWNWLWNQNKNALKENDLGYYIGYAICEKYYNNATDKKQAIKDLVELEYSDEKAFAAFVDGTKFLPMTLREIDLKYESMRPKIKKIREFKNGSQSVSPALNVITLEFSEPMSACCRSFDFDPAKAARSLRVKKVLGWSDDKKRFAFEVEALQPNTNYQLIISNFAKADGGNRLAPYTLEFKTKAQ